MTLRQKLLLAQLPLIATLLAIGWASVRQTHALGLGSAAILKDNYRSVLAVERMKEALERLDSAAVFRALGEPGLAATQARENRPRFEQELSAQENNITEVGEAEATARLAEGWQQYLKLYDRFSALAEPGQLQRTYFEELEPRFLSVKDDLDLILGINEDAMVRKSDAAHNAAERLDNFLRLATLLALVLGTGASAVFTARLLRPLAGLAQASRRIGEGDLEARAAVRGRDEVASLAREFNQMAERLRQYRQSSLGELLLAQTASQAAIDGLPDAVLIFDTTGELLSTNEAAGRLLRVAPGGNLQPLTQAEPAVREAIERVRSHVLMGKGAYQPKGLEEAVRVEGPDGQRYLLPRATPVHAEGQLRGAAVILQDVTRLQRFDELTNNLVATVAHELRTPLTSLRMAIHLCLEQAAGPITAKQADLLFAAREDCERLQTMVDDLLDLSRLQSGREQLELATVRVAKLLDDARDAQLGLAAEQDSVIASEDLTADGVVRVDEERLRLVFSNLVVNAIRHSPRGGSVTLRAKPEGLFVRFEVSDQGAGIPAEYQQRVFDKFFRAPGAVGAGAGLGLYIAREIVLAHKGEIGVESELRDAAAPSGSPSPSRHLPEPASGAWALGCAVAEPSSNRRRAGTGSGAKY